MEQTKQSPTTGGAVTGEVILNRNGIGKVRVLHPEKQVIKPEFQPLQSPETFQNINPFEESEAPGTAREILNKLLEAVGPLDFDLLAFPELEQLRKQARELQAKVTPEGENEADIQKLQAITKKIEKKKANERQKLIISVENILTIAESNNWGLCKNGGFIYLYNGTHWVKLDKDTLTNFLGETAEKQGIQKLTARYFDFRDKLLKQFFASAFLPIPEPPVNTVLLNLKNGTLGVTPTGTSLRPFSPADFLTYQLPFNYEPEATAPMFIKFLNRVLPEQDLQNILSEFLGYVFIRTSYLKLEKALLLYGTGANGKSVVYDIVNALLGTENVTSYSLESLTDRNGYYRAMIAGVLVNYASEINGKLETSFFKQLASGEPVEARLPYGEPFTITDYAKLAFNLNELPREIEHTNAYFRRLLIIPFNEVIPESEQNKELAKQIIEAELSGVFNWALKGLNRLLQNKRFTESDTVNKTREAYKLESDSVRGFIADNNYTPSETIGILYKVLYSEYRAYCLEDGYKPVHKGNFRKRLEAQGIRIEKVGSEGNKVFIQQTGGLPY
jgi:putative DNA primase/helicase